MTAVSHPQALDWLAEAERLVDAAEEAARLDGHPMARTFEKNRLTAARAALLSHLRKAAGAQDADALQKAIDALTGLSSMYAATWDRTDGGLFMDAQHVQRFERAHQQAVETISALRATMASTGGGMDQ